MEMLGGELEGQRALGPTAIPTHFYALLRVLPLYCVFFGQSWPRHRKLARGQGPGLTTKRALGGAME